VGWNSDENISVKAPAAPAIDATIVLFNTATAFADTKKAIALMGLSRFVVVFNRLSHASAANGLVQYSSSDGGTNWRQVEAGETIAAVAAGTVDPHEFPIDIFDDWKLEYTNGGTLPTTWDVTMKLICGQRVVAV
jgi:hypothetical protein